MKGAIQYQAPQWAEGIVWYQIFPERFRNGDPANDPTRERVNGPEDWHITPWTQDWYKRDEWEKRTSPSFYSTVFTRRYGGDLQGVLDKLDYLKDLGVGVIYFNPLFDARSLHKYDASYYHHIDRNFGPDPEGDAELIKTEDPGDPATWKWTAADSLFLKIIKAAHKRDIRVVLDGVWNHTGTDFWAFRDIVEKQENSPFKDWYVIKKMNNPDTAEDEFHYEGWWGLKTLPVWREEAGNLVTPVKEHIFAITRRWMDPNGKGNPGDGIDGWRLDVPEEIGNEFWKEWHSLVREINPEAITVGEIWTDKAKEFINPQMFTTVMNYRFAYASKDFFIDEKITTKDFIDRLEQIEKDYPAGAGLVLQNLMDSHDTARLASFVVNKGLKEYDSKTSPKDNFNVRKPNEQERQIQKLIALFQFTWKGAPMLYYGTEAGMWGADDPDDRKPMVWEDLNYEPETHHPLYIHRPVDDNNFDRNLYRFYKSLADLKNNEPALKRGNAEIIYHSPAKQLVVFCRSYNDESIWVIINRSVKEQQIDLSHLIDKPEAKDILSGGLFSFFNLTIGPISGLILK